MSGINILNKKFGFNSFGAVAPFVCPDLDATLFINAAGLTNLTEKQAICQLVQDLKAYNLWNALITIYPMVGSTPLSCSLNLKNVLQYQIGWYVLWAFTPTGAKPNGVNSWANTGLNPAATTSISAGNISMSYYSRTQSAISSTEAGCQGLNIQNTYLIVKIPSDAPNDDYSRLFASKSMPSPIASSASYSLGFSTLIKPKNNVLQIYHDGVMVHAENVTVPTALPNYNIYLGATNVHGTAGGFSDKECAWFSVGRTLTTLENATLYTIVQNFQTTLSRQV